MMGKQTRNFDKADAIQAAIPEIPTKTPEPTQIKPISPIEFVSRTQHDMIFALNDKVSLETFLSVIEKGARDTDFHFIHSNGIVIFVGTKAVSLIPDLTKLKFLGIEIMWSPFDAGMKENQFRVVIK